VDGGTLCVTARAQNYESDDPDMLADVALATDCVIAPIQQHCARRLFAVDVLLTNKDLQAIGARVIPETQRNRELVVADAVRRNRSPRSNSLLTGQLTANLPFFASLGDACSDKKPVCQRVFEQH
jgi:hypothetical protein